jgi:hypothetical protein
MLWPLDKGYCSAEGTSAPFRFDHTAASVLGDLTRDPSHTFVVDRSDKNAAHVSCECQQITVVVAPMTRASRLLPLYPALQLEFDDLSGLADQPASSMVQCCVEDISATASQVFLRRRTRVDRCVRKCVVKGARPPRPSTSATARVAPDRIHRLPDRRRTR